MNCLQWARERGCDEKDDEEDLDVRDFVFDGKQYIIDSTGNLFDTKTHEHIGIYNSEELKITFI